MRSDTEICGREQVIAFIAVLPNLVIRSSCPRTDGRALRTALAAGQMERLSGTTSSDMSPDVTVVLRGMDRNTVFRSMAYL